MKVSVAEKLPLITLVGPPNSGKTTLFNYLSGKNFKTVNYPGATVEYSISKLLKKFNFEANLLDSPGIISLIPNSPDEKVTIDSLYFHEKLGSPDLVIATVDSSQLSRHLLLVKQLLESNFKVIVALTMTDILNKKGYDVSVSRLRDELNCDIVKIDGRTGEGISDLIISIEANIESLNANVKKHPIYFNADLEMNRLINSYKDIGRIETNVIYPFHKNGSHPDIDSANRQLKIINSPVSRILNKPDSHTLFIDKILLHKFWGLVLFFLIMSCIFTSIFWLAEPLMQYIDETFGFLSSSSQTLLGDNWLGNLISDGVIAGTGSVLVFLPQILILFLILGLLEDTGYLARGAMLIDKPLSKIGLNGKSFVPMLSGFACAIPAILSARTITNKRERLLTIFIIPLMSCSARLPVYALLIAFLFPPESSWAGGLTLGAIYLFSITSSVAIAGLINKFKNKLIKAEDNSSFILELPAYRKPKFSIVLNNTYTSVKLYLKKAGPTILFFSIAIWFLTYFPNNNPEINEKNLTHEEIVEIKNAERLSNSYAAELGKIIQPVMAPIGMDWRVGVSLIAAFAAREVFVSSLALIFKVTSTNDNLQESMILAMRESRNEFTGEKLFTTATIIGLIVFFVFALQCISTIAVAKKETGGWRIPLLQVFIFTSLAYILTFLTVNGLRAAGIN
jgi:ferrous iron transport protein B